MYFNSSLQTKPKSFCDKRDLTELHTVTEVAELLGRQSLVHYIHFHSFHPPQLQKFLSQVTALLISTASLIF